MSRTDLLRRAFAYDSWANQQMLECLAGMPLIHDLVGTWSHLVLVHQLWLKRVNGETYPQLNLWTVLTVPESAALLKETDRHWQAFLDDLTDEDLDGLVAFTSTEGKPQQDPLDEVLLHLTHHTAFLRGQLAVKVKATGLQPPALDPILWLRTTRTAAAQARG